MVATKLTNKAVIVVSFQEYILGQPSFPPQLQQIIKEFFHLLYIQSWLYFGWS